MSNWKKSVYISLSIAVVVQAMLAIASWNRTLPKENVPGCFVYQRPNTTTLNSYCSGRRNILRLKDGVLDAETRFLQYDESLPGTMLLSHFGASRILTVDTRESIASISTDVSLGLDPGSHWHWSEWKGKLNRIDGKGDQAILLSMDMRGNTERQRLPVLPSGVAPSGEWRAVPTISKNGDIAFTVPPEGRIIIVDGLEGEARFAAIGSDPQWSPDGTRLAYRVTGTYFQRTLAVVDISSGETSRVAVWRARTLLDLIPFGRPTYIYNIVWHSSGDYIACESPLLPFWERRIMVVEISTGRSRTIPALVPPSGWCWMP